MMITRKTMEDAWQAVGSILKKSPRTILHIAELVLILLILLFFLRLCSSGNGKIMEISSSNKEGNISLSPEQIASIENLGQWVFLRIEAEVMVEETKEHLFFKDDDLMRIYRGTLMLGFDLKENQGKDWITVSGDTLSARLPRIRLLDENFINEARTTTFYQNGSWSYKDLKMMRSKAIARMKKENLTEQNLSEARKNAKENMTAFFSSFGFRHIRISFGQ